ncbi:MAG: hypothetical protein LBB30_03390 [Candidatus Methanoplasma sp.]|jgi:hypothetical protein|nr:hypothetical protein [Candidatus Methanoplasma sp.]
MKKPNLKVPDVISKVRGSDALGAKNKKPSERAERAHESRLLIYSIFAIIFYIAIAWVAVAVFADGEVTMTDIVRGSMGSVFALLFAVIIMDTINSRSEKRKKRREERKAIVRHNKIIQPVIDMYLVRKNMVITLNDKSVRKFKVNAVFTIKDMKDMYSLSELISDVGKTKIEVYAYYQEKLHEKFTHLVEDVDFSYYSDLCDAAMKYINATSYGASALDAVVGYQDTMAGTKSMRSMVVNLIREEPENGKFIDAPPVLKNVYLVHQMINDQETALERYLKLVQGIIEEDSREAGRKAASEIDYE